MSTVDPEQVIRLRRAVARLARRLNTPATDEGLTPTQASVLALVVGRGPIGVAEVVRLEHINPTMASRVVGRLDELGLIIRTPDPDDLRSATLAVTPLGRKVQSRVKQQRAAAMSAAAARLPDDERAALTAALDALEHLAEELP